jgi:hypothetical protein
MEGNMKPMSIGRHKKHCKVCSHSQKAEIEQEWLDWGDTNRIASDYGLSRDSIYRHAHALGLYDRRRKNLRRALEKLIERGEMVPLTANAMVAAIQVLAKINSNGQLIDRSEVVDLSKLFERMSMAELTNYAEKGILPNWFTSALSATPNYSEM